MFPFQVNLSGIPFEVGGDLYSVSPTHAYMITRSRHAIDGIVVLEDGVGILAYGTIFLREDQYCLTSLEHAEAWAKEHRPALPCPYEDIAEDWMKTAETLPAYSRPVAVIADGKQMPAYYQNETKQFYRADSQSDVPLEHVTEWTEKPDSENHCSIMDVQVEERREPKLQHMEELEL